MSTDANIPNLEEIAYWNEEAGSRWVALQERIDRAFAPFSAAALASAAPKSGEAVLDIGCGCGATVLDLAGAVGSSGAVLGIDISRTMLAHAEQRTKAHSLPAARFIVADASTHAFDENSIDLAFSRFGVMFFDDPIAALANVRRSLRPNGRFVFVCWRDLAANPWFHVPVEAVRPHVPRQPKLDPEAPGPLAFADPDRLRGILQQAGFGDVNIDALDAKLLFGSRASATELLSQVGPATRLLAGADERARAHAVRALDEALSAHEADGDVTLGAGVWIVVAQPARA
jgi:SAM-dependent methyltransferase